MTGLEPLDLEATAPSIEPTVVNKVFISYCSSSKKDVLLALK